jgi:hypothetical protein
VGFDRPPDFADRRLQIRLQCREQHVHNGPGDARHAGTEDGRRERPKAAVGASSPKHAGQDGRIVTRRLADARHAILEKD